MDCSRISPDNRKVRVRLDPQARSGEFPPPVSAEESLKGKVSIPKQFKRKKIDGRGPSSPTTPGFNFPSLPLSTQATER